MGRFGPYSGQIAYHDAIRTTRPTGPGGIASVGFPETGRPAGRLTATAQHAPGPQPLPWSGRLRRGKLRRPDLPASALPRPRLMARIDDGRSPLTLIVAPAGFGKTTVAAEWASQEPRAAWLTADAADASLPRFWAHLREALGDVAPGFGELVGDALDVPHRATAADLGRLFADELLDAAAPVRLVIDDFHLVPESETHAFLGGLLEIAPPGFRLVITARSEPPLALTRLRLRGAMRELRGNDLLFTAEETRLLVARASPGDADGASTQTRRRSGNGRAGGRRDCIWPPSRRRTPPRPRRC